MPKLIRNFLAILIIAMGTLTPSVVFAQTESIPVVQDISQKNENEYIENEVKVQDLDIEPINTQNVKNEVIPNPSQEGKKVIGLFLKMMVAVIFCAALSYLILLFVKKNLNLFNENDSEEYEDLDLSTPDNKHDALRSFLSRTK